MAEFEMEGTQFFVRSSCNILIITKIVNVPLLNLVMGSGTD
jgi:hypothetical protein